MPSALAQDTGITRYHAKIESGELVIFANEKPCTDTMSGERFAYTVEVQAKPASDTKKYDHLQAIDQHQNVLRYA